MTLRRIFTIGSLILTFSAFIQACKPATNNDSGNQEGGNQDYPAVDMGLSVLWATRNVGADSPNGVGTLYLWRSTLPSWPDPWRLPTRSEIEELIDNCSWVDVSGGYLATSLLNGNTLFFPKGGVMGDNGLYNEDFGEYWSSTLQTDVPDNAYRLQITPDMVYCSSKYIMNGRLIRAVRPK